MKCKNCGTESDSKFCPSCGARMDETGPEIVDKKRGEKKAKKPILKRWWFWVLAVFVLFILIGALSGGDETPVKSSSNIPNEEGEVTPTEEESTPIENIDTEYTLSAGYYTAGIDLPIGKCDVVAVSGAGNLSSSNMYSGGMNEMFGIDDGSGWYTDSFNGLKMKKNVTLDVSGDLVVKLIYTKIDDGFTGRQYNEAAAVTLSNGNYVSGEDFPSGVYNIIAVSGSGNISSSNMFDGGINEMFGIDDGSGWYTSSCKNVELKDGVDLELSGGLTVKLIPAT